MCTHYEVKNIRPVLSAAAISTSRDRRNMQIGSRLIRLQRIEAVNARTVGRRGNVREWSRDMALEHQSHGVKVVEQVDPVFRIDGLKTAAERALSPLQCD